jgi:hypothetical protein
MKAYWFDNRPVRKQISRTLQFSTENPSRATSARIMTPEELLIPTICVVLV